MKAEDSRHIWHIAASLMFIVLAALVTLFYDTVRSIVLIWNSSGTFAHGYIIPPISAWLIWQQRTVLARCNPNPAWLGLVGLAGAVMLWLLADLAEVQVVAQYSFVAMILLAALSILGWAVVRQILFPLIFLLLAVPFGDMFIDPLIQFTADFTVTALQWSGIPVLREGNSFSIPSGNWSVVTACSGVRYLIASFTLGCIYAYLTYRSAWRRLLFILAALVVPIFANGMRAYMIVMIGHLSNMQYAVGVDHLIYGWIFFGFVMLILFWVGSFWREDVRLSETSSAEMISVNSPPAQPRVMVAAMVGVLMVAASGPWCSRLLSRLTAAQPPVVLVAPKIDAWIELPTPFTNWHPQYHQPAAEQIRFYTHQGQQVGLYIGYYRNQHQGSKLISYINAPAMPGGDDWRRLEESAYRLQTGKYDFAVRQSLLGGGEQRLLVFHWYWMDDKFTANAYVAKMRQAWDKLTMHGDDGAVVMIFAPMGNSQKLVTAALNEFAHDALPAIEQTLRRAHAK